MRGKEGRDVSGEARGEEVCIVWLMSGYAIGVLRKVLRRIPERWYSPLDKTWNREHGLRRKESEIPKLL